MLIADILRAIDERHPVKALVELRLIVERQLLAWPRCAVVLADDGARYLLADHIARNVLQALPCVLGTDGDEP